MRALLDVLLFALSLYKDVIIVMAIMSWLLAFDVINVRNPLARSIWDFLNSLTEPALRHIRRYIPSTGGVDLSPIGLYLAIMLLENVILRYIYPNVF